MHSSFMSVVFVASIFVFGQAAIAADDTEQQAAIAKAIERLGDKQFSVREAASKFLWQQGDAAVDALRKAATSPDREVRVRAKKILDDFQSGLRPSVSAEEVGWIRTFRDGNAQAQLQVLASVVSQDRFDVLVRLLNTTPQFELRQQMLLTLATNADAVPKLAAKGRIQKIVEQISADQDAGNKSKLVSQFYFSPLVLKYLTENERLSEVLAFISNEDDAMLRRTRIQLLLANSSVVKLYLERKQLDKLLRFITLEADPDSRRVLLASMFTNQFIGSLLVEQGNFETVLKFARENLTPAARSYWFGVLSHQPRLMQALVDKYGLQPLLKLIGEEQDADARGQMLGALVLNEIVWNLLHEGKPSSQWLKLVQDQPSIITRRAILKTILLRNSRVKLLADREVENQLWEMVRADDNRDWQAFMLVRLHNPQNQEQRFNNEQDRRWLVDLLKGEPNQDRLGLLQWLITNKSLLNNVIDDGHFETLTEIAKGTPQANRGAILAQLFATPSALRELAKTKRLTMILSLWREEKVAEVKENYLRQVLQSNTIVAELVAHDSAAELMTLIQSIEEPKLKLELLAILLRHGQILQQMFETKKFDEILAEVRNTPDVESRRSFCHQLFQIPTALTFLVDQGRSNNLIELWRAESDKSHQLRLLGHLLNVPKIATLMLNEPLGSEVTKLIEGSDVSTEARNEFHTNLFNSPQILEALAEAGYVEKLWTWALAKSDRDDLSLRLHQLLASPVVLKKLASTNRIGKLLADAMKTASAEGRESIFRQFVYSDLFLSQLAKEKQLDALLGVMHEINDFNLIMHFLSQPAVLKELDSSKKLHTFFDLRKKFADTEQTKIAFAQAIFQRSQIVNLLLRNGFRDQVVAMIQDEPNMVVRIKTIGAAVSNGRDTTPFGKLVQELKLADQLISFAETDKDIGVRVVARRAIFEQTMFFQNLATTQFDRLFKLAIAEDNNELQGVFLAHLLTQPTTTKSIVEKGLLPQVWKKVQAGIFEDRSTFTVTHAMAQNRALIEAMIANDLYSPLVTFFKQRQNQSYLLAQLYSQPAVLKHLISKHGGEGLVKILRTEVDANNRSNLLQRIVLNEEVIRLLLEQDQLFAIVELAEPASDDPLESGIRSRGFLGSLLSRPTVLKWLVANKKLPTFLDRVCADANPSSRRTNMQRLLSTPDFLQTCVNEQQLPALWKFVNSEADDTNRETLTGLLVTNRDFVAWYLKDRDYTEVLKSLKRPQALFNLPGLLTALIDRGDFESLWKTVAEQESAIVRVNLTGRLLAVPSAFKQLEQTNRLVEAWKIVASTEGDIAELEKVRKTLLLTPSAVSLLLEKGYFETLANWAKKFTPRNQYFVDFYTNPDVVKHVLEKQGGAEYLKLFQAENESTKDAFLKRLFYNQAFLASTGSADRQQKSASAVAQLVAADLLLPLLDMAKEIDESSRSENHLQLQLLSNHTVINWAIENNRLALVLGRIKKTAGDRNLRDSLQQLLYSRGPNQEAKLQKIANQLWQMGIKETDATTRQTIFEIILSESTIANRAAKKYGCDGLVELLGGADPIFANVELLQALVKEGHFEALWKLANASEKAERGLRLGRLLTVPQAFALLMKEDRFEEVWKIVSSEDSNSPAMSNLRNRLLLDNKIATELIVRGHFETLRKWTQENRDGSFNWSRFLVQPSTVKYLIEKRGAAEFMKIISEEKNELQRGSLVSILLETPASLDQFIEHDLIEELLKFARIPVSRIHSFHIRDGNKIPIHPATSILHSNNLINALAKKKQLGLLLKFIAEEKDDLCRYGMAEIAVGGHYYNGPEPSLFVKLLVSNEHMEELWKWAVSDSYEPIRRSLMKGILKTKPAIEWLAKGKSPEELLKTLDNDDAVFSTKALLDVLVTKELVESLWHRASHSTNEKRRGLYVTRLAQTDLGKKLIDKPERVQEYWNLVQASQLEQSEMQELSAFILQTPIVLDTLLAQGQANDLVAWGARSKESFAWRNLVLHPKVIEAKVKRDGAAEYMKWLTSADRSQLSSVVHSLISNYPSSVAMLVEGGQFDELIRLIRLQNNQTNQNFLLQQLNRVPAAAAELSKRSDLKVPPVTVRELQKSSSQLLIEFQTNPSRLQAWLKENSWEALLKLADESNSPQRKPTVKQQLLVSSGVAMYFAEKGDLEPWLIELRKQTGWEWPPLFINAIFSTPATRSFLTKPQVATAIANISKEPQTGPQQRQVAQRILSNSTLRQTLFDAGKESLVRELVAMATDRGTRSYLAQQVFQSPSGLYGHLILNGRHEEAEKMLREDLSDDAGRLRWISYLVANNKVVDEINRLTRGEAAKDSMLNPELLVRLHRANGNFEAAQRYADNVSDAFRREALFVEARDWEGAAKALQRIPAGDKTRMGEQLDRLAGYQRLAGDRNAADATLLVLKSSLTEKSSPSHQWIVAKTLLIHEQWDAALPLLEKADAPKAFSLYRKRMDYANALRMVAATPGAKFDQDWFDSHLIVPKQSMWPTLCVEEFAVEVAMFLQQLGRNEDAEKIMLLLEARFATNNKKASGSSPNEPIVRAMAAIYRNFGVERTSALMEKYLAPIQQHSLLHHLIPQEQILASFWDNWLHLTKPHSSYSQRFSELIRLMKREFSPNEFDQLTKQVEEHLQVMETRSPSIQLMSQWPLGFGYAKYNRFDDARRCLEKAISVTPQAESELIKTLRISEDWPALAKRAEASFEQDRERVYLLYVAGDAWQRVGEIERGRKMKSQARLLSLDNFRRFIVARELLNVGLAEDARAEFEIILKSSPIGGTEWQDASRLLVELQRKREPAKSADFDQQFLLINPQVLRNLTSHEEFVTLPISIRMRRAKKAIEAGDDKNIQAEIRGLLAANPGDSSISIELIPLLEKAKQSESAQRLFATQFKYLDSVCTDFPRSATAHNELAWLAARCRKNLDDALRHAMLAVELAPTAPHIDTLAEVHFQRGDRDSAIDQARRAAALAPHNAELQERKKHFETAPLSQAP